MTDNNFLTLNGTEALWVVPRHPDGSMGAYQWITTTQAIANLATFGNAVHVTNPTYTVQLTDGLLLVDCVAAGNVDVVITLPNISVAPRPVIIKKIDTNTLLNVWVYTNDSAIIEYFSAGQPFIFNTVGQAYTFNPALPLQSQWWLT